MNSGGMDLVYKWPCRRAILSPSSSLFRSCSPLVRFFSCLYLLRPLFLLSNQEMEKTEGSKELAGFPRKFLRYLLPALFKVATTRTCRGIRHREVEKIVRYEVEMALVVSAGGFSWSRALKEKLEREGKNDSFCLVDVLHGLLTPPLTTTPLTLTSYDADLDPDTDETIELRGVGWVPKEDEVVDQFMGTLRSILPGGEEMEVGDLVSEVESYVVCLKMQVTLLQSLLDVHLGSPLLV